MTNRNLLPTAYCRLPPSQFRRPILLVVTTLLLLTGRCLALDQSTDYFVIEIVDAQTGRGVPLVELRTTDEVAYYTDSNGIVAFREPGLMNRSVFFTITSPGYEFAADGFGLHGTALQTVTGKKTTIKIRRLNIAERLYRATGAGIYRDSVLAGLPVPLRDPLINGDVVGQDSVHAVPYKRKLHWFWGDTSRPDYPLGNFGTTGATSALNSDPNRGTNFNYFTGANGFARAMVPIEGPGPVWISSVTTIENGSRLIGYFARVEGLVRTLERGLVVYNDATDTFERAATFDAAKPAPLDGHPIQAVDRGAAYLVGTSTSGAPLPNIRVAATLSALKDVGSYESYTCLTGGGPESESRVDRDDDGKPIYKWKRGAPAFTIERQKKLVAAGTLKADEGLYRLRDVETGNPLIPHTGSVYWNAFCGRWVMIFGQAGGGVSNVGEIWFAQADTAVGPWIYARKVATHPKMDFYNPTQHPFFDEENGRRIYFEGTYVNTFSGNPVATPRYNYNQIVYRLSLDDLRLSMPLPVYKLASGMYRMREDLNLPADASQVRAIAFYAVPPTHPHAGLVPIYWDRGALTNSPSTPAASPLCYILPASKTAGPETLILKDYSGQTLGSGWRNPQIVLAIDFVLTPVTPSK